MTKLVIWSVTLILCLTTLPLFSIAANYNVVDLGARPDGRTDSTHEFFQAWTRACSSGGPATVYVPRGIFLIKSVTFSGPCRNRILFQIDGTLVAPWEYSAIGSSEFWILFYKVNRVSVHGGTIDARGAGFWDCRRTKRHCPSGARSLTFLGSSNVMISGLTSLNSQTIHIAIGQCNNVWIQNVYTRAPSNSPNTDGIHVQYSNRVSITRSIFRTGDDCISIGPGSRNLWIRRIGCGPGHGISIGSLGNNFNEEGVENVTVSGAVFTKTQNGVRIKAWAKSSNAFARNIVFRNIVVRNVAYPVIIDQKYCPQKGCHSQHSGVEVSQVNYSNIKGTSATQTAVKFDCSPYKPCRGIRMQDIKLTYARNTSPAIASCNNARGTSSGKVIPKTCF